MNPRVRVGIDSLLGPEMVALLIGAVLWGSALVVPLLGRSTDLGGVGIASPSPSGAAQATPSVDAAAVRSVQGANATLLDRGQAIEALLQRSPVDPVALAAALGDIQVQVRVAMEALRPLSSSASTTRLAADIFAVYASIERAIAATIGLGMRDLTGWSAGSANVVADIRTLKAFEPRMTALLTLGSDPGPDASGPTAASPVPSGQTRPSPSASAAPASPSPSASSPTPSPAPSPSTSPSPTIANVLDDPGFQDPQLAGWTLDVVPPAAATMIADATGDIDPGAAVVTISATSDARSAVAVVQPGIAIEAGQRYRASFTARSDGPREVRLRIASADGITYAVGIYSTDPTWRTFTLDLQPLAADPGAVFRLEVGRSDVTVSFDHAEFGRVG